MRWTKTPPTEPGQYRVRRRIGPKVWQDTVTVWMDEQEGLMVVDDNGYIAWSQPIEEWIAEYSSVSWSGPVNSAEEEA